MFVSSSRTPANRIALINGEKLPYDVCSNSKDSYTDCPWFKRIGEGVVYSINDIRQKNAMKQHFFVNTK